MGLRFRKSVSLGKHARLNLGKKGVGFSIGKKGFRLGVGSRGPYSSVGIPGTGISNLTYLGSSKSKGTKSKFSNTPLKQNAMLVPTSPGYTPIGCIVILFLFFIALFINYIRDNPIVIAGISVLFIIVIIVWAKSPKTKTHSKIKSIKKLINENRNDEAIILLKDLLEKEPENSTILSSLGRLLSNLNKFEEATIYLNKLIKLKPNAYSEIFLLGNCYYQIQKYDEAINTLQKIPENYEDIINILKLIAICFNKNKKNNLAIETLKRTPLLKRNIDQEMLEIHYLLGSIYEEEGDYNNALKHYNKVLANNMKYQDVEKRVERIEKKKSE